MSKVPDIVPITDLRHDAAAVLRRLKGSPDPLVITQRGRTAAIMLSPEAYERARRERELLRLLARGDREIVTEAGHSLESVLRDADALLDEEP
ncbi:MAG: type II toxin-antitoxin system Phd/YefM family antitoxin [Gemmatimonadetes bacterium]|nr:type II toxin-antitoxin system Phd/YefM family antitoxin [Gemmatimonadota bacterium]